MSDDNYKRATFIIESDNKLDLRIEGKGPLILNQHQFRMMSMAAREMLTGHAASCWQDYVPDVGYIRVVKRKFLCNNKCTRKGMQAVREIQEKPNRLIPTVEVVKKVKRVTLPKIKLKRPSFA